MSENLRSTSIPHTFQRNLGGVIYNITGDLAQSTEGTSLKRITATNTQTGKVHSLRDIEIPHSGETAVFTCEAIAQHQAELLLHLMATVKLRE
jgi:hypothetical protein